MDSETKEFIEAVLALLTFIGLLYTVLTSQATEALKYLAINIVLLGIVVLYILLVLRKRIEKLEERY